MQNYEARFHHTIEKFTCYTYEQNSNNNTVQNDTIVLSLDKYFKLLSCAELTCWFEKFFKRHEFYFFLCFRVFNRCNETVQRVNYLLSQSGKIHFYVCIKWKAFLKCLKWGCIMTSNCTNPQITSISVLRLGKNEHQSVYQEGFSLTLCLTFHLALHLHQIRCSYKQICTVA